MITGASPRLISSNRIRSGIRHQGAPDRDHLLLSARQRGRCLNSAPLFKDREEMEHGLQRPGPGAADLPADQKVLFDRERGKQLPPLRHQRDAVASPPDRLWQRADRLTSVGRSDRRPLLISPEIERISVVLPAPLAPMMARTSPSATFMSRPIERLKIAVMGVEAADLARMRLRHRLRSRDRFPALQGSA